LGAKEWGAIDFHDDGAGSTAQFREDACLFFAIIGQETTRFDFWKNGGILISGLEIGPFLFVS
jgi:hypothetical protein